MLATRPHHQTAKPLTLYKRLPLENKEFQALFMLKPLFIKRKQLNFQKHIDRAKTNPARQSPRAGLFARRSAPSRRFCARAGARCVSVRPAGARAIPPATCCCTTNWMSIKNSLHSGKECSEFVWQGYVGFMQSNLLGFYYLQEPGKYFAGIVPAAHLNDETCVGIAATVNASPALFIGVSVIVFPSIAVSPKP